MRKNGVPTGFNARAEVAKRSLTARFWTRFHMAIILSGVLASGLLCSNKERGQDPTLDT
jgi:hypothetical protein